MTKPLASIEVQNGAVIARLNTEAERARKNAKWQYAVGYTMPYSVYVHEDLKARHTAPTQAKYLEAPMRRYKGQILQVQAKALRGGAGPRQALALAGNYLLGKSREIVPVDTGALKASGFVQVDNKG